MSLYLRQLKIILRVPTALTTLGKPCFTPNAVSYPSTHRTTKSGLGSAGGYALSANVPIKQEPSLRTLLLRRHVSRPHKLFPLSKCTFYGLNYGCTKRVCHCPPRIPFLPRLYGDDWGFVSKFHGLVDHIGPIDREKRVEMHLYNGPTWMSTVKLHKNKPWTAKKKPIKAHSQWISLGDNEQGIDCVVDATAMRPNCWFMYEYETYFPPTGWELISSRPTLTSVGNFLAWLRDTGITIFTPNGQDRPEEPYAIPPPLWPET